MRNLFLLFLIILASAPAGLAQSDYSDWEFFIGYAHERANNGAHRLDARGRAVSSTGATSRVDFVSKRVGNYQYNPQWGVLLGQVWVK